MDRDYSVRLAIGSASRSPITCSEFPLRRWRGLMDEGVSTAISPFIYFRISLEKVGEMDGQEMR
jgi:hypothetical protein